MTVTKGSRGTEITSKERDQYWIPEILPGPKAQTTQNALRRALRHGKCTGTCAFRLEPRTEAVVYVAKVARWETVGVHLSRERLYKFVIV